MQPGDLTMISTKVAALLLTTVLAVTLSERSAPLRRFPRRPDPDSVFFPESFLDHPTTNEAPRIANQLPNEIPLDFVLRLNEVQNVTELFRDYVKITPAAFGFDTEDTLVNRFGDLERKAVTNPKPAGCMPEIRTVSLTEDLNPDPTLFYYPSCTRVERCGGCCTHNLLSCQPSQMEMINFQVIATQYTGNNNLRFVKKEVVEIEQHKKCKCDCIIKRDDCNEFQEYRDKECRCVCMNLDDEMKCNAENETKLWDHNTCTCGCRKVKECSTGYYHDEKTCSCKPVPITRRTVTERFGGDYDRKRDSIGRFDYKIVRGFSPSSTENESTKNKQTRFTD